MGRRSEHSREDLHAMCLAAARRIVAADGPGALTARRIAREIGYSPGTLYNVFENLDELALHLNAATLDDLHQRLVEALRGQPDVRAALRAMARAYVDCARAEPQLWAALFEHRMSDGRSRPDWYVERIARLFQLVERTLSPLFGTPAAEECRRAARILWSALHGIASLALAQKLELLTQLSAEEMADELVVTYLAGLQAKPPI
jgi:AcrR family transcriptional regulator